MKNKWPSVKLGTVLYLDLDRVEVDTATSYPMVGVLSFGRGLFDRAPIENGNTSYRFFYRLKADHVVMSQLFGWEGALALSNEQFAGKFLSPQFPTFLCDRSRLERQFLGWLMRRPAFWEDLSLKASGMGDRRRTLNPEALFACEIPLPPATEQRRVVARIEELVTQVEEARGLRRQAVEEAKALNISILVSLLPKSAPIKRLHEVTAPSSKISYGVLVPGPDVEDGVPFVRVQDLALRNPPAVPAKRIAAEVDTQYSRTRLHGGEILIGVVGSIGKVGIAPDSWSGANIARAVCRIVPDENSVDRDYLAAVLSAPPAQDYFRETTRTLAQPTLNVAQLSNTPIPIPSLSEQRQIVAELNALQVEVDVLKHLQAETATELDALIPSILSKAFTGEL